MDALPPVSAQLIPFPELPVDVARYILETAAYMNRATALQLVVLSKAVFAWIDPILYRVVVLSSVECTKSFWTTIQARGPEPFARNVKTLVFDGNWWTPDSPILQLIFSACSGVTSLTWWIFYEAASYAPKNLFITHLHLLEKFPYATKCIPCSVTHLSLSTEYMMDLNDTLAQIVVRCPDLTHICVSDCLPIVFDLHADVFSEYVNDLLALLPPIVEVFAMRLNANAMRMQQKSLEDSLTMIKDPRFVPICTNQSWYRYSLTGLACQKTGLRMDMEIWTSGRLQNSIFDQRLTRVVFSCYSLIVNLLTSR